METEATAAGKVRTCALLSQSDSLMTRAWFCFSFQGRGRAALPLAAARTPSRTPGSVHRRPLGQVEGTGASCGHALVAQAHGIPGELAPGADAISAAFLMRSSDSGSPTTGGGSGSCIRMPLAGAHAAAARRAAPQPAVPPHADAQPLQQLLRPARASPLAPRRHGRGVPARPRRRWSRRWAARRRWCWRCCRAAPPSSRRTRRHRPKPRLPPPPPAVDVGEDEDEDDLDSVGVYARIRPGLNAPRDPAIVVKKRYDQQSDIQVGAASAATTFREGLDDC